jgi:predicted enzyme related to lactoylglutathione lyase
MKTLLLMTVLTLSVTNVEAHVKQNVPAPGTVAWFDITTSNLNLSRQFYGQLFGWTFKAIPSTDQGVVIQAAGQEVGTLRRVDGRLSRFNGMVYITVTDINASYQKARSLGATVEAEGVFPLNLPDGKGAIAVVFDREGHPVGMYSSTPAR